MVEMEAPWSISDIFDIEPQFLPVPSGSSVSRSRFERSFPSLVSGASAPGVEDMPTAIMPNVNALGVLLPPNGLILDEAFLRRDALLEEAKRRMDDLLASLRNS